MGRWPLVEKCMSLYQQTGDEKYLFEAQQWRNKLYLRYELIFRVKGEYLRVTFAAETPYENVIEVSKLTGYNTIEECKQIIRKHLQYIPSDYSFSTPEVVEWKTK